MHDVHDLFNGVRPEPAAAGVLYKSLGNDLDPVCRLGFRFDDLGDFGGFFGLPFRAKIVAARVEDCVLHGLYVRSGEPDLIRDCHLRRPLPIAAVTEAAFPFRLNEGP